MTNQGERTRSHLPRGEATIWIEHDHAVINEHGPDGIERVEVLDRAGAETEDGFEARTIDEIGDRDWVVVSGPAFARTGFERAYVAMTHRPDRLVDVEPTAAKSRLVGRPA